TACDKFIYIEIIGMSAADDDEAGVDEKQKTSRENGKGITKVDKEAINLIAATVSDLADEDGWAFLGEVGNLMNKRHPNFDPRNYGFYKLTPLIKSLNQFEIDERDTDKKTIKHIYIRNNKTRSVRKSCSYN